jgi:probable phosphomutase (TIGR03848 family)
MSPRRPPEPPTVVLYVRHGLTPTTGREMPAPGPGPELSPVGRQQAEEAGRLIADWAPGLPPLAALYTSPLARTAETAAIVGRAVALTPEPRPGLVDCDAGDWAGTPLKDLSKKSEWPTVQRYPSGFRFPGGEALADMRERAMAEVRAAISAHRGQTVIMVSHADPIKAVMADALGLHLDLFQRVLVSPASVNAVSYGPLGPTVMLVNWTGPASRLPPEATGGKKGR